MEEEKILTEREIEVLSLLYKGYSNKLIAEKLFVTIHTVKFHLENIYRKLETHNRIQTIIKAIEMKIL